MANRTQITTEIWDAYVMEQKAKQELAERNQRAMAYSRKVRAKAKKRNEALTLILQAIACLPLVYGVLFLTTLV